MKYSKKFERDYKWYLSVSDFFTFDGASEYFNKKGVDMIQYDKDGLSAKECFYLFDSMGKIKPTREPEKLHKLYKTKGSVNLHIQMYAEDRASGVLPKALFKEEICDEINPPKWFIKAVEKQKYNYYEKYFDL